MGQVILYLTLASLEDFFTLVGEFFTGWKVETDIEQRIVTVSKRRLFSKQRIVFTAMSRADGEEFGEMLRAMRDFYASIETDKEAVKEGILAQIPVFTLAATIQADKDMDDDTFGAVLAIAGEGHGLLFLPPADLYNADGDLVFNVEGASDLDSYTVTAPSALLDQHTRPTESGEARKDRSNAFLAEKGVPLCRHLPPIVGDEDFVPRGKREVAGRTLGVLMSAVFAEVSRDEGAEDAREFIGKMLDEYDVHDFLSPEERDFIDAPDPDEQTVTNFVWRYECAWVGLWALGFVDELSYPAAICDVPVLADTVRECGNLETFLARASLREPSAILDEADLIYRCDWACVEARINGGEAPAGLEPGVVMERHRMLNWLIRYRNAEWDDVTTDT